MLPPPVPRRLPYWHPSFRPPEPRPVSTAIWDYRAGCGITWEARSYWPPKTDRAGGLQGYCLQTFPPPSDTHGPKPLAEPGRKSQDPQNTTKHQKFTGAGDTHSPKPYGLTPWPQAWLLVSSASSPCICWTSDLKVADEAAA